jgi:hypothetical protein
MIRMSTQKVDIFFDINYKQKKTGFKSLFLFLGKS